MNSIFGERTPNKMRVLKLKGALFEGALHGAGDRGVEERESKRNTGRI